jgi:hypothetical protein
LRARYNIVENILPGCGLKKAWMLNNSLKTEIKITISLSQPTDEEVGDP